MIKTVFIFACALFLTINIQAQKKTTKIQPPLHLNVPPAPKLSPGPQQMKALEENPLEGLDVAFKADPIYITTDTAFIVQESYFTPGGYYLARISIENAMYPANFTKDSLAVREGYINVPRETMVQYLDGAYRFDGKYPKQSKQLIFTDSQKKKDITFSIIWDNKKSGTNKKIIKSLLNTKTNKVWIATEPLPISPTM